MKKVKLFYNPFSGNKTFKFDLDVCIGVFQSAGYEVHPFRTMQPGTSKPMWHRWIKIMILWWLPAATAL